MHPGSDSPDRRQADRRTSGSLTNIGASNRLLRQYLHKNADLSALTQDDVDAIAATLNHRPRRVLGWATPAEAFGLVEPTRLQLG